MRLVHAMWLRDMYTVRLLVVDITVTHLMLKFLGLDVCVVDFFARFD